MKKTRNKKRGVVIGASIALTGMALVALSEKAEAVESISVTLDTTTQKTIESSQLRVWLKNDGRYGIQLKSNGATIFYGQDSAYLNITRSGSFPNGMTYNQFSNLTLKSFVVNGTTIEQTRTDGTFDYIFRLSIINATSQGAYMKAEIEMKNLTSTAQNVGASFNIDTMVNGNDSSPFRIIPNGWEAFNNGVQVTAYYKDVFNVTNADAIYLGQYSNQYPMPIASFTNDQIIYPGDSGAGFYYNPKNVGAYTSRKESWIMGMGPRNVNPTFSLSAPTDNQTFYRGQTLQISGTASDTDVGDKLDVKWSVDGGAEKLISSFIANGSNQSFSQNYTLPNDLADGWHTLQVWVMDDKGGVSSSNTKRFFINNFIAPGAPTYQNVTTDGFTVSFDKKGNVDSTTYELQRMHNGSKVEIGTATSKVESGLLPNTKYDYAVRAKNTSNEYTTYSATTSIYTLANQPTGNNLVSNVLGQATLSWNANGNPSGTKYSYEVRRVSDNAVVKNGETTSMTATVTGLPTDVPYKVYVKAINGDSKATSETYLGDILQDTINPGIVLTKNVSTWTNGAVTISANATDVGTGVKRIKLPDGNWMTGSSVDYIVNANGDYTFLVEDNAGNVTSKTIQVTNIDKDTPVATHIIEHVDADTYRVTVQATDKTSGMKQIKSSNGQITNGATATLLVKKGETHTFELQDVAGNTSNYVVKADVPDLSVYQKDDHVKAEWAIEIMQDLLMGYAKSQLFRGNDKVYEGTAFNYEDQVATDKTNPNPVDSIQVSPKNGKVFMKVQAPSDNGTAYEYMVKAVSNKGDILASEKKKVLVTAGIDGYSYVVDTNTGTTPDNTIDSRATDIEIPVTTNAKYYVHIKSIDKAGNVSDVKHLPFQDNVAPEMTLSQNPTTWTNTSVQLNATANDVGLGVKRIQLPNGTWVDGETASQSVTANGTYTFVVEDLVGNQTTKTITITNIDKTAPTAPTINNNQEWTRGTPVAVSMTAGTDSQSGVKHVEYRLEGATVKGWTTYVGSFDIVNEGETRIVARTVDNLGQFSAEYTSFARIDLSAPHNLGITIKLKP